MKLRTMSVAALFFLLPACSTEQPEDAAERDGADTTSSELAICKKGQCGPALGMPALLCSDGSIGGNTGRCLRTKGLCQWEIRACPAPTPPPVPPALDCNAPGACGPALGMPNTLCDDGKTWAGPTGRCLDKGGVCGWEIATCPPPPPGAACGKNVCSAKQSCCEGMPFREPTCIDGTMCPISQRKMKKDIAYLSAEDTQRLSDELMDFRLATYRYKSEGEAERTHLGFIIDDVAPSAAVVSSGERVDMYGYATMTVAALQVQAREMAALRKQVDDLKRELGKKPSAR